MSLVRLNTLLTHITEFCYVGVLLLVVIEITLLFDTRRRKALQVSYNSNIH